MILYINSCVRKESRTAQLADVLLNQLGEYKMVKLDTLDIKPLNEESLTYRSKLQEQNNFDDAIFDLAKDFAMADTIVISAPFWDGGFPALLKTYLENIYVIGLVTDYDEMGKPVGLCRAKKLYYVTTAGGKYIPTYGYEYVRDLCTRIFGIMDTECIYAENLDIIGYDANSILEEAKNQIRRSL